MKPVDEVVACVVDYGTFISIAEKLAETMQTVYYYSPHEREYQTVRDTYRGDVAGTSNQKGPIRTYDPLSPDLLDTIDLFVFPDIGYAGLQRHLRSIGKAVWGHMGADELELDRELFADTLTRLGLPLVPHDVVVGVTALAEYLKDVRNKWIKVSQFRGNMETWHHVDYICSERTLDSLAVIFGGAKETITFLVYDDIASDIECGYDGWCIDGEFPSASFQGYEKKNELYLGAVTLDARLPSVIKEVNEAMSLVLADYGYRCWWATEIRVKDNTAYFIDPTPRMPGQTGEHQLESVANLADIIWSGANGIVRIPIFRWKFVAEATLHYDANTKDAVIGDEWKALELPKKALRWLKLYSYCIINGVHHFVGENTDEIGVIIGGGGTPEAAIEHLCDNLALLKDLPVHAETAGFADLVASIEHAEAAGIPFGGKVPSPEAVFGKITKAGES